jgi:hypothetical protein
MSTAFVIIDVAAGVIFLLRAFSAIVHMSGRTRHDIRFVYWLLAVGALGLLLSPLVDAEWRRSAHVSIIAALAILALIDHRGSQSDCRSDQSPPDRRDHGRQGIEKDLA